jgi:hypothetical protein
MEVMSKDAVVEKISVEGYLFLHQIRRWNMKRVRGLFQICAGLAIFLLFIVGLSACSWPCKKGPSGNCITVAAQKTTTAFVMS